MEKEGGEKNMRTVKITNCSYQLYEAIRDAIYKHIPFCLVNQGYSPKEKIGMFNFWDSDYIPESLEKFILRPPKHREPVDELQKDLEKIITKKTKA